MDYFLYAMPCKTIKNKKDNARTSIGEVKVKYVFFSQPQVETWISQREHPASPMSMVSALKSVPARLWLSG